MKSLFLALLFSCLFFTPVWAGKVIIPFDTEKELQVFFPAQTKNCGTLSRWLLLSDPTAPSGGKALGVIPDPRTNYGSCFNVFLHRNLKAKDLKLSVWVKAIKGREDQGGGPIWRAKDANNYYVVRWNPLEDNFRLYYVKNGRRKMLASSRVKADPHRWHKIEVEHQKDLIKCYFDGRLLLQKKDQTFMKAGTIGLWSKADAQTAFDKLEISLP